MTNMINNNFLKNALIGGILFFLFLNVFSQDTLKYKYIEKIHDKIYNTCNVKQYFVNDSVFVVDGLFNYESKYYFRVVNGQWFMKYDFDGITFFSEYKKYEDTTIIEYIYATYGKDLVNEIEQWYMKYDFDWQTFFNGKEGTCGDWVIEGRYLTAEWKKTNIVDNTDTVYKFRWNDIPQILDGRMRIIPSIDGGSDYYFTYLSGIIAFYTDWGNFYVREDKMYLSDSISIEKYK